MWLILVDQRADSLYSLQNTIQIKGTSVEYSGCTVEGIGAGFFFAQWYTSTSGNPAAAFHLFLFCFKTKIRQRKNTKECKMDAGVGGVTRRSQRGAQRNIQACDNFISEISPPDTNSNAEQAYTEYAPTAGRMCRAVAKIVKVWKSPSGFVKGKALSRGTGIGLINFDSYSFGKGFQLGPLSLPATDPTKLRVNEYLFGLVHEHSGKKEAGSRAIRGYARCTRANGLVAVIEGIHSSSFSRDMYQPFPVEYSICASLLLGKYGYALDMRHRVSSIRKLVLELCIFCRSGRIWRQFCHCLEENPSAEAEAEAERFPHIEYRSIMAFCDRQTKKTEKIDALLGKPLWSKPTACK